MAVAAEVHVQPKSAEVFVQILHSFNHVLPGLEEYCTIVREKRCPELKREGRFVLVVDFPAVVFTSRLALCPRCAELRLRHRPVHGLQRRLHNEQKQDWALTRPLPYPDGRVNLALLAPEVDIDFRTFMQPDDDVDEMIW